MNNYPDEQLIKLAIKNDNVALETLIKRYLKLVYSVAFRYVRSREDAEDITQDVFIKVWRNLRKFDQERMFKPWVCQITKNTCLDLLRKNKGAASADQLTDNIVDTSPTPATLAEQGLLTRKLAFAMNKLPPKYREVISLYQTGDLNFREISDLTLAPLNTVKSRFRRGRLLLKKLLNT